MMLRKSLFLFFLFLPIPSFCTEPDIPLHVIYDDPWALFDFLFITAPEKEINSFLHSITKTILYTAAIAPGTYWLETNQTLKDIPVDFSSKINKKLFADIGISCAASTLSIALITLINKYLITERIYNKHFKNFIIEWPTLRERIPTTLQTVFDHIYIQYAEKKSDNYLNRIASILLPKIQTALYAKYPCKYAGGTNATTSFLLRSLGISTTSILLSFGISNHKMLLELISKISPFKPKEAEPEKKETYNELFGPNKDVETANQGEANLDHLIKNLHLNETGDGKEKTDGED